MRILSDSAKHTWLGIISICVLSVIISACGVPKFPKPIGVAPPPQVNDLNAQVIPRSVELSWSPVVVKEDKSIVYLIMRSELIWENRNCLECPPPQQQLVLKMDAAAVKPGGDGKIRWVDTNVSYRRVFRYQITLEDEKGLPVSLSNPAIAKVLPGPTAPVNLTATTQPQGIMIQWKPALKDIEGNNIDVSNESFRLERLSGEKGWEKAGPSFLKTDAYLDQSVAPGQSYMYRVVGALYADEVYILGEPSATTQAKGPESVQPPPPGRVWITPAHEVLEIHWTEADGKTGGYHVYRREGKEIIRLTASPVAHPPFVDHDAKKGATYSYAVSAVSAQADHKEGLLSKWIEVRNLITE